MKRHGKGAISQRHLAAAAATFVAGFVAGFVLLRTLVLGRELESAADPVAFLDSLDLGERMLAGAFVLLVFGRRFSESELKRLIGDPRFEDLSERFYEALILRRAAKTAGMKAREE